MAHDLKAACAPNFAACVEAAMQFKVPIIVFFSLGSSGGSAWGHARVLSLPLVIELAPTMNSLLCRSRYRWESTGQAASGDPL
jgi:hypothetical protein